MFNALSVRPSRVSWDLGMLGKMENQSIFVQDYLTKVTIQEEWVSNIFQYLWKLQAINLSSMYSGHGAGVFELWYSSLNEFAFRAFYQLESSTHGMLLDNFGELFLYTGKLGHAVLSLSSRNVSEPCLLSI